jgi:DNA-directed RNA polymerase subunit beta
LVTASPINSSLRDFFTNLLSQMMDQTNALAELTHKRRCCLGRVVFQRDCKYGIRGIHATHYGRIVPLRHRKEKNAGLVNYNNIC